MVENWIWTMREELEPAAAENYEFEWREELILTELFGFCAPLGFWSKNQKKGFRNQTVV